MDMPDVSTAELLEYLYKEYVRLNDEFASWARSSFEDFKLLAAVGTLLAWGPIAETIGPNRESTVTQNALPLLGFIAIVLIILIIGMRDLFKQSVVNLYLQQIDLYETEIRAILGQNDTKIFKLERAKV